MAMELGLTKLPWYGQIGAFVALSGIAAAGFYNFYVVPAQEDMAIRQTQLDGLRANIQKAQVTAQRLPQFEGDIKDLEGRLEGLKVVLPEQKDVADLLRRIQTLAMQSNLRIKGFKPQPIATKELHAEWPIVLEIDGTYHNLGYFFDRISKFSRIINISDLNIRATDKPDENATITAQCMATTFVLLENPPAATATTGTAPPPAP
jgi:type IV pilus assembly protein PilO